MSRILYDNRFSFSSHCTENLVQLYLALIISFYFRNFYLPMTTLTRLEILCSHFFLLHIKRWKKSFFFCCYDLVYRIFCIFIFFKQTLYFVFVASELDDNSFQSSFYSFNTILFFQQYSVAI